MNVRAAGYVIFRRISNNIEFLLLQASYGDYHWSPPKGHVDPGENEAETALREVSEESGLCQSDLKIIPGFEKVLKYEVKNKPKCVVYWLAELQDPNKEVKLSHEHQAFAWVPLLEACELGNYTETKDLLQSANNYIMNFKEK